MEKFKYINDIPEFPACNSSQEHEELCAEYILAGAIPKSELVSGDWYIGQSRSTNIAQWFSKPKKFYFIRYKMGGEYVDTIRHFQDDNGYDLFIPFKHIEIL